MRNIKLNVVLQVFYQILAIIVPFITIPLVSRVFGAEGIGEYTFSHTVILYFSIFSILGTSTLGTRIIAKCTGDKEKRDKEFWNVYYFQLFISLIVIALYYSYIFIFKQNTLLNIVMGLYLVGCLFDINWYFFGTEKFAVTVVKNSFVKIISLVLILTLIKEKEDLWLYALILVGSIAVSNIVLWINLFIEVKFLKPSITGIKSHIRENLILFLPTIAASIFVYADKIMLGFFSNKSEVGYYESMEKILNIPMAISTAIDTVIFSRNVKLYSIGKIDELKKTISKFLSIILVFTVAASFGIAAISNDFVPFYFGDGFKKVIILLKIGGVYLLFRVIRSSLKSQIMLPCQMDKKYIITLFIAGFLNLIVNLILIPFYGSLGATIATIISETFLVFVCLYFSKNYISFKNLICDLIFLLLDGILMYFIVYSLEKWLVYSTIVNIILEISIGALSFLIVYAVYFGLKRYFRRKNNERI